jgi:hypothetical protein
VVTADILSRNSHPASGCDASTAAPHPEELRATMDLRVGKCITVSTAARATPAGLVAVAVLVSAVMIPVIWISRHRRGA